MIQCQLCGETFDGSAPIGCESCPMGGSCTLACCPNCGFTTVDVQRSGPARLVARLLGSPQRRPHAHTVADTPRDGVVEVTGFSEMASDSVALLRAYGLDIGRTVRVVQHRPMTIVEVDHTEVALERDLASLITVAAVNQSSARDL